MDRCSQGNEASAYWSSPILGQTCMRTIPCHNGLPFAVHTTNSIWKRGLLATFSRYRGTQSRSRSFQGETKRNQLGVSFSTLRQPSFFFFFLFGSLSCFWQPVGEGGGAGYPWNAGAVNYTVHFWNSKDLDITRTTPAMGTPDESTPVLRSPGVPIVGRFRPFFSFFSRSRKI